MFKRNVIIFFIYAVIIASYAVIFGGKEFVQLIGREDGPVENIGAISFIIASFLFSICYLNSKGLENDFWVIKTKRNLFYLLLAILFFLCFGEEISWGQRIFGWDTPAGWNEINAQGETTIHNLWIFQSRHPDGTRKSFLELFLNMSRLFSIFWFLYCIVVPIIYRYSKKAKKIFERLALPISPLWIGGLFLTNYIIFHLITDVFLGPIESARGSLNELKESNYALIFAIFASYELYKLIKWKK